MESNTISKSKSKINVKLIAITAMCAALVTVTTAFIKIPSMFGYSHAGDSMIYLAASILPGPYGIIASSIGGALPVIRSGQFLLLSSRLLMLFRLFFAEWL